MPEQGKIYIFLASSEEDGSLQVCGSNSNILLENDIIKSIDAAKDNLGTDKEILSSSNIVALYKNAVANQVSYSRERYKSVYEITESDTLFENANDESFNESTDGASN